jgi:radical SAM superfamily enzyme YgiQ (UPF0313 family)
MERVLFIVPPCIKFEDFISPTSNARFKEKNGKLYGNVLADMPIGVLSMSAYIKANMSAIPMTSHVKEIKTELLDLNIVLNKMPDFSYNNFLDFFKQELMEYKQFNPTIVCISALFSPAYRNMINLGELSRDLFPCSYVLAGGALPTNMYKEIYEETDCFNALCYGEGELPLARFINSTVKEDALRWDDSWITAGKIAMEEDFSFSFIEDLDEIPFYDYDLCDVTDYGISPAIIAYSKIEEKTQNFHVMTSRGCNFHCTFCSSHTVHGRKMRYFSVDRVREDFTKLKELYNAHTLIFQDDHFLADKNRALQIIDIIKELDIKVVFQNGLALYGLTKDMLVALKSAGVDHTVLAVESGSQRVLKELMNKPLTLDIIKKVAEDCREVGIYTDVNIIIGMPGETKQDIYDAKEFLKTIKTNWFRVTVATPLVGSDMYNTCIDKGYINDNFAEAHYKKAIIETPEFTPEWLEEAQYQMNLELNFIHNSDFREGNYEDALNGFLNAIKAKSDHAIAYYYAALCYERISSHILDKGSSALANETMRTANKYFSKAKEYAKDPFWKKYIEMFNIEELK